MKRNHITENTIAHYGHFFKKVLTKKNNVIIYFCRTNDRGQNNGSNYISKFNKFNFFIVKPNLFF